MTDERFDSTVTTTCGYCGVGCRLEAHARAGRVVVDQPGGRRPRQPRATPASRAASPTSSRARASA